MLGRIIDRTSRPSNCSNSSVTNPSLGLLTNNPFILSMHRLVQSVAALAYIQASAPAATLPESRGLHAQNASRATPRRRLLEHATPPVQWDGDCGPGVHSSFALPSVATLRKEARPHGVLSWLSRTFLHSQASSEPI